MQDSVVGQRYAKALFHQAVATNQVLACQQGLEEMVRILKGTLSVKDVLNHPFISPDEKKRVLHAALGEFATPLLERFLQMLVARHRFNMLFSIADEFQDAVDHYQNVQALKVRSAFPMSEAQKQALKTHLEKWLGSKVRMEIQVDTSLIGGVVVQTEDRILDESVKGQLSRLKAQLSA